MNPYKELFEDKEEPQKCAICFNATAGPDHTSTLDHRLNWILLEWNNYRKHIVKNRHGVKVTVRLLNTAAGEDGLAYSEDTKNGSHISQATSAQAVQQKDGFKFLFSVKNVASKNNVYIINYNILYPHEDFSLEVENNTKPIIMLLPGAIYRFKVIYKPRCIVIGEFENPVAIQFQTEDEKCFSISRNVVVKVSDEKDFVFSKKEKSPFTNIEWHDVRTWNPPVSKSHRELNYFRIPHKYKTALKMGLRMYHSASADYLLLIDKLKASLYPDYPTENNYKDFFHLVLWLDEMSCKLMLQRYNMEKITMRCQGKYLELEVRGLAEKRPSLINGDTINIRTHEDHTAYKGIINRVTDTTIWIEGVHSEIVELIRDTPDVELDVQFELGRLPYVRMHVGIDRCWERNMLKCLFPDTSLNIPSLIQPRPILPTFYDTAIACNPEQKIAVESILNCTSGKAPYIVFGPPGTGKTATIVEAILQIKKYTNKRILVCAPANAACDMLTGKLAAYCTANELIRVHTENRDCETLPVEIKSYSNYSEEQKIFKLTGTELMQYRIVVTTLVLSGRYSNNQTYFPDCVFIDEAAQATEPETTIPLSLLSPGKQFILAGDPKQLGPILSSKVAEKYKLGVPLLERLMSNELYENYDTNFISLLKLNYRSHPVVLQVPNELFYANRLQTKSLSALNDPIAKICIYDKICPKQIKGLVPMEPVEFCAIFANEEREGRSPSYFNRHEIAMVLKYVVALTSLTEARVKQSHIGVVTPYIRQVYRIKERLKNNNFGDIEVGTTEAFQGREKRIIIISTVRAQTSLLLEDKRYQLGFVGNKQRFNVALTRAMSKLIVIGCPTVLRYDNHWLRFIEFCEGKRSYFGARVDRRDHRVKQQIIDRMSHVKKTDGQSKKK